ncbi:hypothetical protein, partial [Mesorhizobium sp. M2C.T.Ca.TU.002.02.1.1]|uniref:hypothetical protein n=1 Tax=Mesorhizobium sp. M2C.T.Ca.TU.002.02.1.1 TaxID=2496788 RepID=UPI0019D25563
MFAALCHMLGIDRNMPSSRQASALATAVPLPRLRPGFSVIFPAQAGSTLPRRNFHISTSHCISMGNMLILNDYSTKEEHAHE